MKEARFQCAERLVRNCVLLYGIPIYVVDGSGPEVNERLRLAGSILEHQSDPGMGPGRRQLFASVENHLAQRGENPEKTYVCWTEPEKDTFAEFIPTLIEPLESDKADIVIFERTEKSLASLPKMQHKFEDFSDFLFQKATGIKAKPFAGPMVFRASLLSIFKNADPRKYGVRDGYVQFTAIIEAVAAGHRIVGKEVDFIYPADQVAEEEGPKALEMFERRREQQDHLGRGFFAHADILGLPKR